MNILLSTISRDTTTQCRASIDMDTVADYAELFSDGVRFPDVILFGDENKSWIGDGWHRIYAATKADFESINADLRPGGRVDALKYALGANISHGKRRTNADKRRCVEIALREFPNLSNRAIAEMCGVSNVSVKNIRDELLNFSSTPPPTRTVGLDGKERPARREEKRDDDSTTGNDEDLIVVKSTGEIINKQQDKQTKTYPCIGMQYARIAIMNLEQIARDDLERAMAFQTVTEWVRENG